MSLRSLSAAAIALAMTVSIGHAQEADFLKSLEGNWSGSGTFRVKSDSSPMKISCKFSSDTTASSLALNGRCTSLVVVSRAIGANLKVNGSKYSGTYTGSSIGTSALNGTRSGNAINLAVRWAKEVNGDREAQLTVQKNGANGMTLTTTDMDPASGKSVVTSQINLKRT